LKNEVAVSEPEPASLKIEHIGGVAHVTFDRPRARNSMDTATCLALFNFLGEADADASVRAIVISGGERDFCTGADIGGSAAAMAKMTTLDYRFAVTNYTALFQRLWEMETPVVSAVTGTVAGAGWMLALLADLVVASDTARWTHVFTRRGMVPHAGDTYFMPRIIPLHRLTEIALLSEPVESAKLLEWGLVNRCVPASEVVPTALALAARLAEGPTRALAMTKRLYRRSLDNDMAAAFEAERVAMALISTTSDRREGVQSLMEKRPAKFIGN
jgi:2-(1,2-epoxy-1,2-dihydrophenyl)acetyl-CoA isomerase